LTDALVGTPPPMPMPARTPPAREATRQIVLDDGSEFWFEAEAPLLTASVARRVLAPPKSTVLRVEAHERQGRRSRRYVPRDERLARPRHPHLRLLTA
jgi:hypothetical protein